MGASAEQRATFLRRKYRERKYRRVMEGLTEQEQLNQVPVEGITRRALISESYRQFYWNIECVARGTLYGSSGLVLE